MVRISALRNRPVIYEEKKTGLLQGIMLDMARKRVRALIVSCGLQGKKTVLWENVSAISNGFVLVSGVGKYTRTPEESSFFFVRDTSGMLAGYVTDYALEERSGRILSIEIATGYLPKELRRRIWVYSYQSSETHADELIIPAALGSELIYPEEGNEICACPL